MKKFVVGLFAIGFAVTGCLDDSSDEALNIHENDDKDLYASVVVKNGYFTDSRDKNKYKIVKIGGLYWFAENLRYADSSETPNLKKNIGCLDNKSKNCEKYGPLYTWTAAMDLDDSLTTKKAGTLRDWQFQGVCPNGWVIPSEKDWNKLLEAVESANGNEGSGTSLKAVSSWDESETVSGGTNRFGFNVLAGGRLNNDGNFQSGGKYAYFWTSDENDAGTAKGFSFHYDKDVASKGEYYKDHGMSVRCVLSQKASITVDGDLDSSYIAEIPFDYGSVTVDGKQYKTVKINNLTWMAENLNVKADDSWCYNNEDASCKKFGRLYSWDAAQTVCPEGWKLPSKEQLGSLYLYHTDYRYLRSTEEWRSKDGLNFWGFDLLPAGGYKNGDFFDKTSSAYLWSSDANGSEAYALFVNYYDTPAIKSFDKKAGYSVRCIMDTNPLRLP